MTIEQENSLQVLNAKGVRTQRFFESDFWLKDLKPFLSAKEKELCLENGGLARRLTTLGTNQAGICEKIALGVSLNSGQIDFMKALLSELQAWLDVGEEAKRKLEESYAKKT